MTATHNRNRAAVKNSVAMLASRLIIAAMGWTGSILIARALSPTEWGQFSFVFGLLGLLSIVTDLGIGRVILARLVDSEDEEVPLVTSSFIALRLVLGMLGYLVALAYVVLMGYSAHVIQATAIAGIVVVIATPSHALTTLFQSQLKMTVVAVAESLAQAVQLILTVIAVMVAPYLLILVLPAVANEIVSLLWKLRGVRRGDTGPLPARSIQVNRWRGMLVDAIPLTIGAAMTTLLTKIDVMMLSRMDDFDAVGQYSVAYKFGDILTVATSAVMASVTTLLVTAWPKEPQEFRRRTRDAVLVLALLGGLSVVVFWPIAQPVMSVLYGRQFAEAAFSAKVLVASAAIAMPTAVALGVLVSTDNSRAYPIAGLLGLATNIALNLYLIPRYSYNGSAVATLIADVLLAATMWLLIRRAVPIRGLFPGWQFLGLLAATGAVVAAGTTLDVFAPAPVIAGVGAILIFFAAWCLRFPAALAVVHHDWRGVLKSGSRVEER
ncbi:flippase [Mycolicibacterium mucogenicum]|uniref:flippase n=1 Tax=Mycolicibacterium mucogenicum TaxID=56689 RepID=UPI00226A9E98|nr:flippase [Mycolicibacterium mucogenicum]MCX8553821.1 flippase [Mycolicibacterium mucogenicum]